MHYVRQTWMAQLILAIFVRGYLSLIQKDCLTHMHGLEVYTKEGLPIERDLSLENSADSYAFKRLYFTQCITSFSSVGLLLHLYAWFLMLLHLT